ncbi:MAG TPA: hypothetical protein VGR01_03265 [Burkholderiales bacterium]|nr:hypothetical protein [Burkholderiales bacterium]
MESSEAITPSAASAGDPACAPGWAQALSVRQDAVNNGATQESNDGME